MHEYIASLNVAKLRRSTMFTLQLLLYHHKKHRGDSMRVTILLANIVIYTDQVGMMAKGCIVA